MQNLKSVHNILVLEDNARLSKLISKILYKNKTYNISPVSNIRQAKKLLDKTYFDLICLDIILPDGNGIDLCREIKTDEKYKTTKILVISQKNKINDKVEIFENGADDYLPKPFHPDELEVRVKNLLGLTKSSQTLLKYKHYTLDKTNMKFLYDKYELPLTRTEFLLLQYIFEHQGFANLNLLTQFLSSKKFTYIDNKSVVVSVKRLKDKLRRNTGNPFIKTKYGSGYYIP